MRIFKQLLGSAQRFDEVVQDKLWLIASVAVLISIWVFLLLCNTIRSFGTFLNSGYDNLRDCGRCAPGGTPMTSEINIFHTANVLIRERGNEADLVAAELADIFLEAGEVDGSAIWRRVLAAVKEIQRQEPREGEAVN